MSSGTPLERLARIETQNQAQLRILADIEKRLRKLEGWRQYMLGAVAIGAIVLNFLRGCG